jgi:hypothetical protein
MEHWPDLLGFPLWQILGLCLKSRLLFVCTQNGLVEEAYAHRLTFRAYRLLFHNRVVEERAVHREEFSVIIRSLGSPTHWPRGRVEHTRMPAHPRT